MYDWVILTSYFTWMYLIIYFLKQGLGCGVSFSKNKYSYSTPCSTSLNKDFYIYIMLWDRKLDVYKYQHPSLDWFFVCIDLPWQSMLLSQRCWGECKEWRITRTSINPQRNVNSDMNNLLISCWKRVLYGIYHNIKLFPLKRRILMRTLLHIFQLSSYCVPV